MKESLSRDILSILSEGAKLTEYIVNPTFYGRKYLFIFNHGKGQSKEAFKQSYFYLKRNGFIDIDSRQGAISIKITPKGIRHIEKTSILNAASLHENVWDGKWRIVTYDIQYRFREKRNATRLLLKNLGFIQMHKSVWINPYDCTKEMERLKSFMKLSSKEIMLIVAEEIDESLRFKKHFKLN